MALQDVADSLNGHLAPQIGQRPHHPIIAPVRVFLGHANDQLLNASVDPGPARGSTYLRAIELAHHESSIPCQDGIRLSRIRDLAESLATEMMTNLAERGPLGVGEPWAFLQLRPQDLVFSNRAVFLKVEE